MIYEVKPIEKFKAFVTVPGSKSITNRALIISALAKGETILKNVLFSDDTIYMMDSLEKFGFAIQRSTQDNIVVIQGGKPGPINGSCFIGNSGTAIRFLSSFIAVKGGAVEFQCVERMKERPIGELAFVLGRLGAEISFLEKQNYPPLKVKSNGIRGGMVKVKGNISSQFITSLLLSAPYTRGGLKIEVEDDLVSKPYVDLTIGVMEEFGVQVENDEYKYFQVKAGQEYIPREFTIEADCSSAAYFFAAAAAIPNSEITVENINTNSLQGDIEFLDIIEKMGAKVERGRNSVKVIGRKLKGIKIDMKDMSDTAQTLAVLALFAEGPTEIKNVYNMRLKETDRISALKNELVRIGARVEEKEDGIIIFPAAQYNPTEIETYDDHRMAMSFAIAGLRIPGVKIRNPECVSKTFPDYFKELDRIYSRY